MDALSHPPLSRPRIGLTSFRMCEGSDRPRIRDISSRFILLCVKTAEKRSRRLHIVDTVPPNENAAPAVTCSADVRERRMIADVQEPIMRQDSGDAPGISIASELDDRVVRHERCE